MIAGLWKRFARRTCSPRNRCASDRRGRTLALEALECRRLLAPATFSINPYLQDPTDTSIVVMWETAQNCANQYNKVQYLNFRRFQAGQLARAR